MARQSQILFSFIALLLISVALIAQVRVDVRLVNVVATVTDVRGRYVSNLTANDFRIEEDNIPQTISHFSQDHEIPITVGVLLDTSGSMEKKVRTAVDAVDRFVRRIRDDDEIFVESFSSQPVLRQDFTSDREKLSLSLRKIWVTGGTALYDAMKDGLSKIRSGTHDKRAILVITDGQDTASLTKLDEVLQQIRESEVLVYSLGISPLTYAQRGEHVPFSWPLPTIFSGKSTPTNTRDEVDMKVLEAFAENSGGRAFTLSESFVRRGAEIDKVLNIIADELRSQYTLGYYPANPDDGRYHSIRIRTRSGDQVRARRGYIAGASQTSSNDK